MSKENYLNIVDENDQIIGKELRSVIHKKGLKHREVHVFLFNEDGIIFQHRAKDKDTFPDLLDASVGGHVELNDDYISTALKEIKEETGLEITENDLIKFDKISNQFTDEITNSINNVFSQKYAYHFFGDIKELKVEEGKSQGFVLLTWEEVFNEKKRPKNIILSLFNKEYMEIYQKIKKMLS